MLDNILFGNTLRDWGLSLLIVVAALVVNKALVFLYDKLIRKITSRSATKLDDVFFESLERPVLLGVVLAALYFALGRLRFEPELVKVISMSLKVVVILDITWFVARLITGLVRENFVDSGDEGQRGRFRIDSKQLPLINRTVLIIVWLIGVVTALKNIGVEVSTLLGTLGIGGVAIALAAQDTIKNIFGGVTIFTDRTFRIGDVININGVEGTVVDIGLRSTRIRTYDHRMVTVPNYSLIDAPVTNISSEPGRRVVLELGLTYDTSPEKMRKAVDLLKSVPERVAEVRHKDLVAVFTNFGDSALTLTFIYFIRKSADVWETKSAVNFDILREFNAAGLNFAFPTQTVFLEKDH
ncbi:MAG: mechanosensitive ion channel family protein [Tannerella sp.]|jgi:MscS family membrane protein|nr:mechanosensitive ion channel family protein [Tannerella sp.]